jgi:hypothetical protein
LLVKTAPQHADTFVLSWIAERCTETGALQATVDIFEFLTDYRLNLKEAYSYAEEEETSPRINVDLRSKGDHHALMELWTKQLRPRLDLDIANQVLSIVVARLRARHNVYRTWRSAERTWDTDTFARSAIEPHDQDKYPDALDVLIDAARDSLEWIIGHAPTEGQAWLQRLAREEAPLLRRLAVHGLTVP